jgi:uncharacterized protein (TIGR00725 family)
MTEPPGRPTIVALFGGNRVPDEVLDAARWIGGQIAAHGFIVMTGGEGKTLERVKEVAIDGAGPDGPWIGVLNNSGGTAGVRAVGRGLVVSPQMADQRNFLEGSLCDAAVVLPGEEGTVSEAVSSLCLGKPVLLVGATWKERVRSGGFPKGCPKLYQLFTTRELTDDQKSTLVKAALDKLEPDCGPMGDRIRESVVPEKLRVSEHSDFVHTTAPAGYGDIARWLAGLRSVPQTGRFPDLGADERQRQMKPGYISWLGAQGTARS